MSEISIDKRQASKLIQQGYRTFIGKHGQQMIRRGGTLIAESNITCLPYYNAVLNTSGLVTPEMLNDVIGYFNSRQLRTAWWYLEPFTDPSLPQLLKQRRFRDVLHETGMVCEMSTIDAASLDGSADDLVVERITNIDQLPLFLNLFTRCFNSPDQFIKDLQRIYTKLLEADEDQYRWYQVYVDGKVSALFSVIWMDNAMGFYQFGVVPELRKKGIGSKIFKHAMRMAKDSGKQWMVLQASHMGNRMYQRAGFVPVSDYYLYMN